MLHGLMNLFCSHPPGDKIILSRLEELSGLFKEAVSEDSSVPNKMVQKTCEQHSQRSWLPQRLYNSTGAAKLTDLTIAHRPGLKEKDVH
eukprot:1161556-Pelagomonas_calceolata.AAC.9